ncbi:MAG TPA: hypothetical protein DCY20_05405 [Firmicutes bacterium]|nr:hypothetical protein [Bacillota bacterium]
MKKLKLALMAMLAVVVTVGCSSDSKEEGTESNVSVVEVGNKIIEEGYIRMPLEITEQQAEEIYHIDGDVVEEYSILKTGISPGTGFAFIIKAKDGQLDAAKAIVEQVKNDTIANAFYPEEQEAAEQAEIIENGNVLALLIFDSEIKEEAINLYKELVK